MVKEKNKLRLVWDGAVWDGAVWGYFQVGSVCHLRIITINFKQDSLCQIEFRTQHVQNTNQKY